MVSWAIIVHLVALSHHLLFLFYLPLFYFTTLVLPSDHKSTKHHYAVMLSQDTQSGHSVSYMV
jgi:hypothetical protein